jgi:hypothetical protein
MDSLEYEIRRRLGQKKFDPINNQKHKRFDFSCHNKKNINIMKLFDDIEFELDGENGNFFEIFELRFYKGSCVLIIETVDIDEDNFSCVYSDVVIEDYTGYGTVYIIKDIILKYSNYKMVLRNEKLNELGI